MQIGKLTGHLYTSSRVVFPVIMQVDTILPSFHETRWSMMWMSTSQTCVDQLVAQSQRIKSHVVMIFNQLIYATSFNWFKAQQSGESIRGRCVLPPPSGYNFHLMNYRARSQDQLKWTSTIQWGTSCFQEAISVSISISSQHVLLNDTKAKYWLFISTIIS